jgi:large subunit ribosomal protein L30
MEKKIKIKLVKSLIGRLPKHVEIAKLLGLKRINATTVHQDTAAIRGMVNIIYYMVDVEECAS